ncbi:GIY-YIG nuclease family protein [Alkalihalophilus pseudofirmus]|uniref:GIY-YIG nuclease family protein n=1 Tax=Alkalihalophilus pseudofirmus TaxID=79885 RepID=A0AAJ2NRH4_ALKPS|nr:GIY-YIG nuclease family protein [Alkalihalophilus pseudofirmus]MDV2887329.1 GIY-YIG nuclease family protein [Alkalihalophilus pseudofirmus]
MSHYVYILECSDHSWYTGYTTDVGRRLDMHSSGKGAKYTKGRGPFTLKYVKEFETKKEALQAEYAIKKLSRKQKERYVLESGENNERTS